MPPAFLALETHKERIIGIVLRCGVLFIIPIKKEEEMIDDFWLFYKRLGYPSLYCHGMKYYKYLLKNKQTGPIRQLGMPDKPYAWQFKVDDIKLTWFDTTALIPASFADIGGTINIELDNEITYQRNEEIRKGYKYQQLIAMLKKYTEILENHKTFFGEFRVRRTIAATAFHTLFDVPKIQRFTGPFDTAYKGGYTECFAPVMKNVHVVDINSSYMFEASKRFPNPYVQPTFTKDRDSKKSGIYYVDIEKTDFPISPLSVYSDKIMPNPINRNALGGVIKHYNLTQSRVWITSPEVDFLEAYGASFTILKGFESPYLDIEARIQKLYELRKTDKALDYPIKLLLNSATGKFGQKDRVSISFVSPFKMEAKDFASMLNQREIDGYTGNAWCNELTDGAYQYRLEINKPCSHRNILVISNITGGAKMNLLHFAYTAGYENVQYVDTDSLTLNDEGFQRLSKYIGKGLGQLKLEEDASKSRIYARKCYRLDGVDNTLGMILKVKGVPKYIKTSIKTTGEYTSTAYASGWKESTLSEAVKNQNMRVKMHKMFEMDLRRYRKFSPESKPYELKKIIEPDYIGEAQTGLSNYF